MSRLATLLMFCAWLLYGAMPAVGMPMMAAGADVAVTPTPMADTGHYDMGHHGMAHHGMPQAAKTQAASHASAAQREACPHGGKICVAPFCAACLTLVTDITFMDGGRLVHGFPEPPIVVLPITDGPAPVTPPPRA